MLVSKLLSSKGSAGVEKVSLEASLGEAAHTLSEKKIGCLLVLGAGDSVVGILSERDIVNAIGQDAGECLAHRVADHMTRDVISCEPSDTVVSVMEKMTAGRFRHMPVMKDGNLVGLISIGDVVKARIDEAEFEREQLARMVAGA